MVISVHIYIICRITLHSIYESLLHFYHVLDLPVLRSKLAIFATISYDRRS